MYAESAWNDGFISGKADFRLGRKIMIRTRFHSASEYQEEYSRGYRAGWEFAEREAKPEPSTGPIDRIAEANALDPWLDRR